MTYLLEATDSQFRGFGFKSSGWLKGCFSYSFFQGWSNEYQDLLGTWCLKVNCLFIVALQPSGCLTLSMKKGHKVLLTFQRN